MADKSEATLEFSLEEMTRHFNRVNSQLYSGEESFKRMMQERNARKPMDDPETPLDTILSRGVRPLRLNPMNPYQVNIQAMDGKWFQTDLYRFLRAIPNKCDACKHAIKKLAYAGDRGAKGARQDIEEAAVAIQAAIKMLDSDQREGTES